MRKALLVLLLWVSASQAATYYVDNCVVTGSDSNNGTSTSTPWLTIAHVNAQTFNPGDSILFQRGCIWHEKLLPPSSGSSVSQITFADYGSGNKPILDGATTPTHWGSGGGVYALQDTFESGTYSNAWSSTQGSVNTWAGLGITGPSGGGQLWRGSRVCPAVRLERRQWDRVLVRDMGPSRRLDRGAHLYRAIWQRCKPDRCDHVRVEQRPDAEQAARL